mmetsp:Transcript_10255/g.33851  ORF Transcript_10255/g.33851 Transcript_10255/m.33851 type:complete len:295 (-) Transcript_10255:12960-13844(-)
MNPQSRRPAKTGGAHPSATRSPCLLRRSRCTPAAHCSWTCGLRVSASWSTPTSSPPSPLLPPCRLRTGRPCSQSSTPPGASPPRPQPTAWRSSAKHGAIGQSMCGCTTPPHGTCCSSHRRLCRHTPLRARASRHPGCRVKHRRLSPSGASSFAQATLACLRLISTAALSHLRMRARPTQQPLRAPSQPPHRHSSGCASLGRGCARPRCRQATLTDGWMAKRMRSWKGQGAACACAQRSRRCCPPALRSQPRRPLQEAGSSCRSARSCSSPPAGRPKRTELSLSRPAVVPSAHYV